MTEEISGDITYVTIPSKKLYGLLEYLGAMVVTDGQAIVDKESNRVGFVKLLLDVAEMLENDPHHSDDALLHVRFALKAIELYDPYMSEDRRSLEDLSERCTKWRCELKQELGERAARFIFRNYKKLKPKIQQEVKKQAEKFLSRLAIAELEQHLPVERHQSIPKPMPQL